MTPLAFLNAVLPDSGVYCVVAIKGKIVEQVFLRSTADVADLVKAAADGVDLYFGCASYDQPTNREQDNVLLVKSLWIDLDVDKGNAKKYDTQAEALGALLTFCKNLDLPLPMAVNSGGGVHAYWTFSEAVEPEVWQPVANKLKAVCRAEGLKIDAGCTGDSARILRIPGTHNYKIKGNPRPVVMIRSKTQPMDVLDFAVKLGAVQTPSSATPNTLPFDVPEHIRGSDDATTKNIAGQHASSSFQVLVDSGKCAQITHIVENQSEIPEPLWRAGLSVAHACVDGEEAIHFMSKEHPEYSEEETVRKAKLTAGPQSCAMFEEERPEGCVGCPHWGVITSPIQLGRVIPLSDNKPIEVADKDAKTEDARKYVIPSYPFPYIRGADGAVVLRNVGVEKGSSDEEIVYPYPFYVVKRLNDPIDGELVWLRLHLPMDGVREFSIPLNHVGAKDRFREAISSQGVAVIGKKLDQLMHYVIRWTQELQKVEKTEQIRTQFGWTEDDTFVIGDREIREDGIFYSPPAAATLNVCNMLSKKGTVEGWRKIADYHDGEGMEARAFAIFMSFGAPLMHFTQLQGGMVNLYSKDSGIGKTAVQHIINAVWGHPLQLILEEKDTPNARIHRIGVLNNIPVTIDELTNQTPLRTSEDLYTYTSGRGKNRMEASTNAERVNVTTWRTIAIASSNASIEDKIRSIKSTAEGELMRLIELPMERDYRHPKAYTDALFAGITLNYGVVGEVYMQYIVKNRDKVRAQLEEIQRELDSNAQLTQRERVWSALAAVAITGATIARSLGLHGIDVQRVSRWVNAFLMDTKTTMASSFVDSGITSLGTFLDEHQQHTLMLDSVPGTSGVPPMPANENRFELLVRVEPDTRNVFISAVHLRKWCAERQIGLNEMLGELRQNGIEVEQLRKRLGTGSKWVSTPVNAYRLYDPTGKIIGSGDLNVKPKLEVVRNTEQKQAN